MSEASDYIEFGATVNDETVRVYVHKDDLPSWALTDLDNEDSLDAIESTVMNIESYYLDFYSGGVDKDAELTDRYATESE